MFALPGLLAVILLDFLRPQEFYPALRGLPLLHGATALAALGFVVDLRLGVSRLRAAPHLVLAVLFLAWSLVSLLVRAPAQVLPRAVSLVIPIAIYLLVAHAVQSFRMLQVLCSVLLAVAVTLSALGIYQAAGDRACFRIVWGEGGRRWIQDGRPCESRLECESETGEPGFDYACEKVGFGGRSAIADRVRWVGTMEDPNELALVISIALPFTFALADRRRTSGRVLLAVIFAAAIASCSYFTRSRGGQLVFLAVLAVYFVRRIGATRGVLIGVLLALPILILGGRSDGGASASTAERTHVWWIGLHIFQAYPFFGVGSGRFTEHHYLTAHNSFILAGAELGVPGLLLFSSILYVAAKIPIEVLRTSAPPVARTWALAVLAAVAGLIVGSMFLSFMYKDVLWIYVGATGALYQAVRRHAPEFRVRFGWRDLGTVALADLVLLAAHVGYTGSKLGW